MGGRNNSAVQKKDKAKSSLTESDKQKIRARCLAAKLLSPGLSKRADYYIKAGVSPDQVSEELLEILVTRQGPEINTKFRIIVCPPGDPDHWLVGIETWRIHLAEQIQDLLASAKEIDEGYQVIAKPETRKRLLRIIKNGGVQSEEDLYLWLAAKGIYPLVYRDQIDDRGGMPKGMTDYLNSRAWVKKFKPSKGGPTRQVPAQYYAVCLAHAFTQFTGEPNWKRVFDLTNRAFPIFEIPKMASRGKESVNRRTRRWIKEMSKRYMRWAQTFRPKPT